MARSTSSAASTVVSSAQVTATATFQNGSGQRVEHAQLEPALGPHRREQGGEVVGEVVDGGPSELVALGEPLAERQRLEDRDAAVGIDADEHHPGVEGVGRPRVDRWEIAAHGRRSGGVERPPRPQSARLPTARQAAAERRVGEAGDQGGPESVGQRPPTLELVGPAEPDVHLDRRGVAHHGAPCRAELVEVALHGLVAGSHRHPLGHPQRVGAEGDELDPVGDARLVEQRQLGGGGPAQLVDGAERCRAQLELSARLDREPAAVGKGGEIVDQRGGPGLGEPVLAPSLAGEPLELDAEPERIGERSEDVLGDVIADVGHREGGARGGHRYSCPKLDSTHSGSRTAG